MRFRRVKGTADLYGEEIDFWDYVEECAKKTARAYGYGEIRTPIFEMTELFTRSVGKETDIVQKEMYTFNDKGNRSLTLRPEGTAPTVRAFLENSMITNGLPQRFFYIGPMFRYERPQSGRLRQFHQFGVELIGSAEPAADVEMILLAIDFLKRLGITKYTVQINSIGCQKCRADYREKIKDYYRPILSSLCNDCKRRYETNVLRLLDCKKDSDFARGAPKMIDFLCDDCKAHYESLKRILKALNVPFTENGRLVRGLDYYTRTVFEVHHDNLGAQSAIIAGGRYDTLIEELGGKSIPALGFATGIERLIIAMKEEGIRVEEAEPKHVYVAVLGEEQFSVALEIADRLRSKNVNVVVETNGKSLKAQLRYASRLNVRLCLIVGENEVKSGVVILRDMLKSEQIDVDIKYAVEYILDYLREDDVLN